MPIKKVLKKMVKAVSKARPKAKAQPKAEPKAVAKPKAKAKKSVVNESECNPFESYVKANNNDIDLPKCNLWLKKFGHDGNGNAIVTLTFPNTPGFSIQTGGTLKQTEKILAGLKPKEFAGLDEKQLQTISRLVGTAIGSALGGRIF